MDRFNTDWVPTLNLGHEKRVEQKNLEQASQRGQRANEKERKRKEQLDRERALAEEIAAKKLKLNEAGEQVSSICFTNEVEQSVDSSTQTEEFDYLVNTGPLPLRPFGEEEFRNNDKKVQFYTGLPSFDILNIVFHRIVPFVNRKSQLLTPFEEFIMTIMKLKVNMPFEDLAYRFNVSVSTVSRTFQAWMIVMDLLSGRNVKHCGIPCLSVFNSLLEKKSQSSLIVLKFLLTDHQTYLHEHKRSHHINIITP